MRFKRHLAYEQGLQQMDIAPLINIVFLVLLFILLIVGFADLPGIRVSLPLRATSSGLGSQNLEIVLDKEGKIFYKARQVSYEQLKVLLVQLPLSKTAVLVKADKDAPLDDLTQIWKICQELGLKQVNIVTTKDR